MTKYAENTSVPSDRSKTEIERTLERYGASRFIYGWEEDFAVVGFEMRNRRIRFMLPLPDKDAREFRLTPTGKTRSQTSAQASWEQATRQRWRALALVIKAKLEAIETGISTFDDEFLSAILLPDGKTVGETVLPKIDIAYKTGKIPSLLPVPNYPVLPQSKESSTTPGYFIEPGACP